jgi:DNA-binding CsgD family transcriptional regulator
LANLVPLAHPRIGATLLLGDAALTGGDLRQAARAYEQAMRDAVRSPSALRGADAFDGFAVLARHRGDDALAGHAAAAAAQVRERAGAAAWPRPSMGRRVEPRGSAPARWLRNGLPTTEAVSDLLQLVDVVRSDPFARLTHAERHVASLVRDGMSNNEIAAHLFISRRTVESHLARIFRKLDVRTRTQLAVLPLPSERDA